MKRAHIIIDDQTAKRVEEINKVIELPLSTLVRIAIKDMHLKYVTVKDRPDD